MKRFLLLVVTIAVSGAFAQNVNNVELCASHKKEAEILENKDARKSFLKDQATIHAVKEKMQSQKSASGTVYTIPVVFHVLHNGGSENISREQILDALRILNRDFRLQNADAQDVVSDFLGLQQDAEIEFSLASKAPDGTCFSGITRTKSPLTSDGSDGGAQVQAIIDGNDVYNGEWPGDKYLNIFICKDIGGAAGYTYRPAWWVGTGMDNGIWVLHDYVGSIGTGSEGRSRTLTHEVGHWLNLAHTWGSTNDPGLSSNCSTDDGISDTPNTIGVTSCNLSENSCGVLANVENYMDYSYCSKMFTAGQVAEMRATLNSSVANRMNVVSDANLQEVGAGPYGVLCNVDLKPEKPVACEGEPITIYDYSYHNQQSWQWEFTHTDMTTSNDTNPEVIFTQAGRPDIALTVSNPTNTLSTSKSDKLLVLYQDGIYPPYYQDMENFTTIYNDEFQVEDEDGDGIIFEIVSGVGYQSNKCIKFDNFNVDYVSGTDMFNNLYTQTFDLSVLSDATLSFDLAYARKASNSSDFLWIYVSNNCGNTWNSLTFKTATTLKTAPDNGTSAFVPSSDAEWQNISVNIPSGFLTEGTMFKFVFRVAGGNNLYIDNINVSGTFKDVPVLNYPEDLSTDVVTNVTIDWKSVQSADSYEYQVDTTMSFNSAMLISSTKTFLGSDPNLSDTEEQLNLMSNTTYYWRVRAISNGVAGDWSNVWSFTTGDVVNGTQSATIQKVEIYPNPVQNTLTVAYPNEAFKLEIYNQIGQKVYQQNARETASIEMNGMPEGVYFVRISSAQNVVVKKVVKK
ncbi:MAG: T9SS C-terminal target domain-containing protein [Bacteroidetes bacterium]|nr:MAG: T9SS C-terminal target domain-containing protein [Bacteroidota bacterium]